mgnify:CR=1 FL=1
MPVPAAATSRLTSRSRGSVDPGRSTNSPPTTSSAARRTDLGPRQGRKEQLGLAGTKESSAICHYQDARGHGMCTPISSRSVFAHSLGEVQHELLVVRGGGQRVGGEAYWGLVLA